MELRSDELWNFSKRLTAIEAKLDVVLQVAVRSQEIVADKGRRPYDKRTIRNLRTEVAKLKDYIKEQEQLGGFPS